MRFLGDRMERRCALTRLVLVFILTLFLRGLSIWVNKYIWVVFQQQFSLFTERHFLWTRICGIWERAYIELKN